MTVSFRPAGTNLLDGGGRCRARCDLNRCPSETGPVEQILACGTNPSSDAQGQET
jgi:hypothetical protein